MTTTSELEAYAKGFKDGWDAARKEFEPGWGRNKNHLQPHMWQNYKVDPQSGTYNKCPVCGAIGVRSEVCYNHDCPTKVTCKTDGFGVPYSSGAGGQAVNVGVGGFGATTRVNYGSQEK